MTWFQSCDTTYRSVGIRNSLKEKSYFYRTLKTYEMYYFNGVNAHFLPSTCDEAFSPQESLSHPTIYQHLKSDMGGPYCPRRPAPTNSIQRTLH
jgi:hypothetical protein